MVESTQLRCSNLGATFVLTSQCNGYKGSQAAKEASADEALAQEDFSRPLLKTKSGGKSFPLVEGFFLIQLTLIYFLLTGRRFEHFLINMGLLTLK